MKRSRRIDTPVGLLEITATHEAVTGIRFAGGAMDGNRDAAAACLTVSSAHPAPGVPPVPADSGADGSTGCKSEDRPGNKSAIAPDGMPKDAPAADGISAEKPDGNSRNPEEKTVTCSGADPAENTVLGPTADPAEILLRQAARELAEYFAGTRREFTFPVAPAGTPFQQAVWAALRTIPFGQTRTYGQIAAQIGRPTACRAVGMANNRNPVAIVVPCHRVVGSGGGLTGYAGGLGVKAFLLELEARPCRCEKVFEPNG